ncbi:MAG TPA: glycosyltransferase, partial [Tepidisphaeraceae bacterium]|nr:glycosyltransferase [Tepidisphaeraceae bacterium]
SLRILGITSLYTTFLQHSMRDWLAGFERLGHETKLLIEPADHLSMGALAFAEALAEYEPDLVVVIDHYRAELGNLPDAIPFVMWVQDLLPNIYNDLAGPAQGPRDFSMGFGRMPLTQVHGYPAERFMGCPIGINEERFKPIALSRQDLDRFGCDASYVSHASTPSDLLLKSALTQNPDPNAARLLWDLHDRLVGDFENGGVTHAEWQVKQKLEESIAQTGVRPSEDSLRQILLLFNTQINNAIFRHQALKWVADLGVHLKLYGNGWEKHPTLGRFACGPADTLRDVPKICAASKVNLQITPHGSVHQRLLEGLVAGGFYLIRWTPGDQLGIAFRLLRDWCLARGIASESALRSKGDEQVRRWISECDELRVDHSDQNEFRLYDRLIAGGEAELTTRAGAVWPEEYPQVSFRSGAELQLRLTRFLGDEQQRQQVAAAMRAQILENYTYASISKRLLRFIGDELRSAQSRVPVAA